LVYNNIINQEGGSGMQKDINQPYPPEITAIFQQMQNDISALRDQLKARDAEIERLTQMLLNAQRARFGQQSEKRKYVISDGSEQLSLFNEAEEEASEDAPEPEIETFVPAHVRKKKQTQEELFKNLPIREVEYDIPPEQLVNEKGYLYECIGREYVRSEISIIPQQVFLMKYYRKIYASKQYEKETGYASILKPELPQPVMKHSMASPSSVADVMTKKYANGMPLNRQEQEWKRRGVALSRNTLANWVIRSTNDWFLPLYERLRQILLEENIIHADETRVQVLKEDGKPAPSQSEMWVYSSAPRSKRQIRYFDYQSNRSGECAKAFLTGYQGILISDGYSGYNKLKGMIRGGCWAHAQRKWRDAIPKDIKLENSKAVQGYDYCNRLFALEKKMAKLSDDNRLEERRKSVSVLLDQYWSWLNTFVPEKGSKLEEAVRYSLNQKDFLCAFMNHGGMEISNNQVENAIRPFAVGRKGWLFCDTPKGASASAVVYTLVETAKANNIDSRKHMTRLNCDD
jgi:transposase